MRPLADPLRRIAQANRSGLPGTSSGLLSIARSLARSPASRACLPIHRYGPSRTGRCRNRLRGQTSASAPGFFGVYQFRRLTGRMPLVFAGRRGLHQRSPRTVREVLVDSQGKRVRVGRRRPIAPNRMLPNGTLDSQVTGSHPVSHGVRRPAQAIDRLGPAGHGLTIASRQSVPSHRTWRPPPSKSGRPSTGSPVCGREGTQRDTPPTRLKKKKREKGKPQETNNHKARRSVPARHSSGVGLAPVSRRRPTDRATDRPTQPIHRSIDRPTRTGWTRPAGIQYRESTISG